MQIRQEAKQAVKYAAVGVLNTVITAVVYYLLRKIDFSVDGANLISYEAGFSILSKRLAERRTHLLGGGTHLLGFTMARVQTFSSVFSRSLGLWIGYVHISCLELSF